MEARGDGYSSGVYDTTLPVCSITPRTRSAHAPRQGQGALEVHRVADLEVAEVGALYVSSITLVRKPSSSKLTAVRSQPLTAIESPRLVPR